jgi:hypothetical protein
MQEILSRCGYRCDLCLAYRPNVEADPAGPQALSEGWATYFGFRIPAAQIVCDGCRAEEPHLIDTSCPVRPCVIERGIANCSECPDFGCEKLAKRLVDYDEVAARISRPIPASDRSRFIAPYENKRRLDLIRSQRSSGT